MVVALVATSLATLGVAALVVLPPLERRVESDRLAALRGLARTIRPALVDVPDRARRRNSPELVTLVDRLQRRAGGRIVVYDAAGVELVDTAATPGGRASGPADVAALRARALRRPDGVVAGERGNVAFAATVAGEPHPMTLVVSKRLDDSRAATAVMRAALPLALAAGLAVALALALLVSRGLVRRLRRLRADAEALGTEGLSHRVDTTGDDEVAVVAQALESMRERLVEELGSQQEFLATASHELRTPLASLQATLELLEEDLRRGAADTRTVAARTETALRQTRRLSALAGDLLDISRLDVGAPLRVEPIELRELASTIAGEFAARLDAAGRSVLVEGEAVLAQADPAAVARILRILLDNAASYGAGPVRVSLAPDGARVRVTVADEGIGISDDERERVFRRFVRGRAGTGSATGAGLGLAIGRGLARAMGGELDAEPSANGARLVLTLPASNEARTPH